jgi:large subunit ribosomal protein L10
MSKALKEMITTELKSRYDGVASACVVELSGMTVIEQEELRGELRKNDAKVHVIKNRLAKVAFRGSPLEPLGDTLEGPCALVTSGGSVIDIAKTLFAVSKSIESLKLKNAIFDGDPDLLTVTELSKMKGLTELIGDIASLVSSPGRAIAGCVKAPQSKIAGCLKTIAEKAA